MLSSVSIFLTHELRLLTNYNEHYLENIKIVKILLSQSKLQSKSLIFVKSMSNCVHRLYIKVGLLRHLQHLKCVLLPSFKSFLSHNY